MLLTLLSAALALPATPDSARPWATSLQAVVVTTEEWEATGASVERWERPTPDAPWRRVGAPIPAVVGRAGLGWGSGLHPRGEAGPTKREGDGRAPAGIFRLPFAFGYAAEPGVRLKVPYRTSTTSSRCVDDPQSRFYNQWVEAVPAMASAWQSHEVMLRQDGLYRLGMWVDHNVNPPAAGEGSCIFLHLWAAPDRPTIGCTAFAPEGLTAILEWLDPAALPILVQLPREARDSRRESWQLP